MNFMSQLYQVGEGGKNLVENTFANIREGLLDKIASLWIECPVKKLPVKVGEMDRKTYAQLDFGTQTFKQCPHCGQDHTWTKADVKLGPRMPLD